MGEIMAREHNRLSTRQVDTTKPPRGKDYRLLCDGGGLYLQVSLGAERNVRRSWIFKFQRKGQRVREMGLGSTRDVGLAEARDLARDYRKLVKDGIDPIDHRNAKVAATIAASTAVITFDHAAKAYVAQHGAGWKNAVHAAQWVSTLKTYASPVLGRIGIGRTVMLQAARRWLIESANHVLASARLPGFLKVRDDGTVESDGDRKADLVARARRWRNQD
jgi:hypothetical protein